MMNITVDDITREEFKDYERLRRSGKINMSDITLVEMLTMLYREQIFFIMRNYKELSKKFPINDEEWESIA